MTTHMPLSDIKAALIELALNGSIDMDKVLGAWQSYNMYNYTSHVFTDAMHHICFGMEYDSTMEYNSKHYGSISRINDSLEFVKTRAAMLLADIKHYIPEG